MPEKYLVALPLDARDFYAQVEHRTRSDLIREALSVRSRITASSALRDRVCPYAPRRFAENYGLLSARNRSALALENGLIRSKSLFWSNVHIVSPYPLDLPDSWKMSSSSACLKTNFRGFERTPIELKGLKTA